MGTHDLFNLFAEMVGYGLVCMTAGGFFGLMVKRGK